MKVFASIIFLLSFSTLANIASNDIQILILEKEKINQRQNADKKKISDYSLVLFYRASCIHCQRFAPIVASWSKRHQASLYAYAMDENVLPSLDKGLIATNEVVASFFKGREILLPSLFAVNTKNLKKYLISQGEIDVQELDERLTGFFVPGGSDHV